MGLRTGHTGSGEGLVRREGLVPCRPNVRVPVFRRCGGRGGQATRATPVRIKNGLREECIMAGASGPADLYGFSQQLADAVQTAAASTVRVSARHGPPASGVAFATDLVLTADHVVESEQELRVCVPDGHEVSATLVGRDAATDLAVLRLETAGLAPARPAVEEPRIGSLALAVARPGREPASSLALISSLGGPVRTLQRGVLERAIQV